MKLPDSPTDKMIIQTVSGNNLQYDEGIRTWKKVPIEAIQISNQTSNEKSSNIWIGSETEYQNLTPNTDTLYFIKEE